MGKQRRIWLAALALAATCGITWLLLSSHESEPVYQGKRLSTWLAQYGESNDGGTSERQAEEAITMIGTNGLPLLLKWMSCRDSVLKRKLIALFRKQSLIKVFSYTDEERHIIARAGFGALGSKAAPAVPTLIALLNTNDDWDVQAEVVMAIGRIGPAAQDAVPAIIKCLQGPNHYAALFAPATLAMIHKQPELVIPALVQHLEAYKHKPLHVRRTIEAIGAFGEQATAAVPALLTILKEQDDTTRSWVTNALNKIDPKAAAKARVK